MSVAPQRANSGSGDSGHKFLYMLPLPRQDHRHLYCHIFLLKSVIKYQKIWHSAADFSDEVEALPLSELPSSFYRGFSLSDSESECCMTESDEMDSDSGYGIERLRRSCGCCCQSTVSVPYSMLCSACSEN